MPLGVEPMGPRQMGGRPRGVKEEIWKWVVRSWICEMFVGCWRVLWDVCIEDYLMGFVPCIIGCEMCTMDPSSGGSLRRSMKKARIESLWELLLIGIYRALRSHTVLIDTFSWKCEYYTSWYGNGSLGDGPEEPFNQACWSSLKQIDAAWLFPLQPYVQIYEVI